MQNLCCKKTKDKATPTLKQSVVVCLLSILGDLEDLGEIENGEVDGLASGVTTLLGNCFTEKRKKSLRDSM